MLHIAYVAEHHFLVVYGEIFFCGSFIFFFWAQTSTIEVFHYSWVLVVVQCELLSPHEIYHNSFLSSLVFYTWITHESASLQRNQCMVWWHSLHTLNFQLRLSTPTAWYFLLDLASASYHIYKEYRSLKNYDIHNVWAFFLHSELMID